MFLGDLTQGGSDLLPRRSLCPRLICVAPVGGFWFGAGLPRPAKGRRGWIRGLIRLRLYTPPKGVDLLRRDRELRAGGWRAE